MKELKKKIVSKAKSMKKRFILFFMIFYSVNLFADIRLLDYANGHSDNPRGGPLTINDTNKNGTKNDIYLRQNNGSSTSEKLSGNSWSFQGPVYVDRAFIPITVNVRYVDGHKAPTTKAKYCLRLTNPGSIHDNMIYTLLNQQERDNLKISSYDHLYDPNPLLRLVGTKKNPWQVLVDKYTTPSSNYKIQGYISHSFRKDAYDSKKEDYKDGSICVIANNGENIYIITEPYAWVYGGGYYPTIGGLDPRFAVDYESIPSPPGVTEVNDLAGKLQVVNEWYGDGGDSQIYTQLIGGDVKVKLANSQKLAHQEAQSIATWYYSNNVRFAVRLSTSNNFVLDMQYLSQFEFETLLEKGVLDFTYPFNIKNITANQPLANYQDLHFEIFVSGISGSQSFVSKDISNHFTARPAKFSADIPANATLVGGQEYYSKDNQMAKIKALDINGKLVRSYNVTLDVNNDLLDSVGKIVKSNIVVWDTRNLTGNQCRDDHNNLLVPNTNNPNKSVIKFTNGEGFIFNGCQDKLAWEQQHGLPSTKTCFFKYPDIGPTKITIYDNIFTKVDQDRARYCTSAAANDATVRFCLPQTAYTDNRRERTTIWTRCFGKLVNRELYNCNIQLDVNFYRFIISKLFADANIVNSDGDMTYYSDQVYSPDGNKTFGLENKTDYKNFKGANLNLIIKATLEDNSTAKLYTKNCYAKDVNLQLDYDDTGVQPNDFTFKRDLANGQDIYFYALENNVTANDDDPNIFKKVGDPYINNGKFYIKSDSFLYGKTTSSLKINLGREYNKAKDPKQVPSARIIFNGNDTDGVQFYKNSSSATPSFGNFFYGRVFTPDYEFTISSKNDENTIKTYYIAYCKNSCNNPTIKSILSVDKHENFLPAYYYIFKNLNVNASNNKLKYAVFNGASGLNPNLETLPNREIKNGIEMFKVKYTEDQFPRIFTITGYFDKDIDPLFPKYLIYDEYYTPSSDLPNSFMFNLRFDNNLNRNWAGYGEQGNVLGIDDKNKDRKRIGNRRIDW